MRFPQQLFLNEDQSAKVHQYYTNDRKTILGILYDQYHNTLLLSDNILVVCPYLIHPSCHILKECYLKKNIKKFRNLLVKEIIEWSARTALKPHVEISIRIYYTSASCDC